MRITQNANVAQPNFQARLKNNDVTKEIVNKMTDKELDKFKNSLDNLSKVGPKDVLEVTKQYGAYYIGNTKDDYYKYPFVEEETLTKLPKGLSRFVFVNNFIDKINKVANPKYGEHSILLDKTKNEPLNKNSENKTDCSNNKSENKTEDKRQAVMNMMF